MTLIIDVVFRGFPQSLKIYNRLISHPPNVKKNSLPFMEPQGLSSC
jgi:hypothetical protein